MWADLDKNRTRRPSPGAACGLLACAIATMALVVIAFEKRTVSPAAVSYGLPDSHVLATPQFDAGSGMEPGTLLERFYRTGDARYLNYARAALEDRQTQTVNDAIILIRLESAAHRFLNAAQLADSVLEREPRNLEARLLRTDALRRAGDLAAARRGCLAVAVSGDPVVGHWCAVQILLSEGRPSAAYEMARELSGSGIRTATATERWAAAVAAEAATLAGHRDHAMEIYERLVASPQADLSTRLAYADVLIAERRSEDVPGLLAKDVGRLPAQVRIAIALKQRNERLDPRLASGIEAAFAGMSPEVTTDLRLRDRAIFELLYNEQPELALRYALANWEQQKGPEDLSLLAETAAAANASDALEIVAQWKSRFGRGAGS